MAKPKLLKILNSNTGDYSSTMIICYPRIITNIGVAHDATNKHITCANKFFIHDTCQFTFVAPCASTEATHLKLQCYAEEGNPNSTLTDVLYELVDTSYTNTSLIEGVFASGAAVSVRIDKTNNRAYVENAAANVGFVSGGDKYVFVSDEVGFGIKKISSATDDTTTTE